ncbi:MAG: hypothetical protein A2X86_07455 [Bdellovibrionales bacterium GWA2_49_15]|nr:MAG: hypothetical protein A2X86_07455 [Bdellovibrionales bacterium GWA2_49_15]HAZ11886.1 hypothetical protein [Bdellovibrionales bacterium]
MRNVATNLSPDILGLLLQSSSASRAKAGQSTSGLEALLENGGNEGQDQATGEGFEDILSMLTFGQGETPQVSEDMAAAPKSSDDGLSELLASLNLQPAKVPTQTQTQINSSSQNTQKNAKFAEREIPSAPQAPNLDLQSILAKARPKVAMAKSGQAEAAVNQLTAMPTEEDAMEMSLFKRDVEQSSIVPGKLTPKTKGLLTGGDFVGLKNGFEQNQLETVGQSALDMKRPIPASYQAEQSKMMNNLATKKQSGVDEGSSLFTSKASELPLASSAVFEKEANTQRFENALKTVNMKGHADLKTGAGPDTKVQDVMGKISDYIVQAKFDKNNSLDVTLRHNEIGQFQMKVSKAASGSGLDIMIRPHSTESQRFFADNQQSLVKGLGESGLKIVDFKVSSPLSGSQVFSESKPDNSNSQFAGARQNSQNFQSPSNNDEQHDSQRRRQLWEQARERLETQYA